MDLFSALTGCSILFVSAACPTPVTHGQAPTRPQKSIEQWRPMIASAAQTFALPEAWIKAVMVQESGGQTVLNGKPITSKAGAMGLMQLMPHTYTDMRKRYGLGDDPYRPGDNIIAGTAYLRSMYERYGYPNMFAAYNAGPGRFDDYLLRQRPLPSETLAYVASIALGAEATFGAPLLANPTPKTVAKKRQSIAAIDGLFFARTGANSLFVTLKASPF